MNLTKSHPDLFFSITYYIMLAAAIFFMLILSGCKDQNDLILAPESNRYFDSSFISYGSYIQSSIPVSILDRVMFNQDNRALIYWYNISPSDVRVKDILGGDTKVEPDQANVPVLDIVFDPSQNGIYNTASLAANPADNWGGLFRHLPKEISKQAQSKNLVMNIWIKLVDAPANATLFVDLGQISEDIIPNGKLDTEDKNQNGLIDAGEDTGIDGLYDIAEPGYNAQTNPDPNHDDFYYKLNGDYSHVNGLEGNSVSVDLGKLPNSEDINRNFTLDQSNNYYSYLIPLDTNKINQNKIVEHGKNGWFKLKIPVDLPDFKVGNLNKSNIETMRLWIFNVSQKVHIRIAEIKFDAL